MNPDIFTGGQVSDGDNLHSCGQHGAGRSQRAVRGDGTLGGRLRSAAAGLYYQPPHHRQLAAAY